MTSAGSDRPRLKVFNWQIGYRQGTTSSGVSRPITATSHVDRLVEDASTAYMAPEVLTDNLPGEHLDIFSSGAIAYHIFSGQAPATSGLELGNKLRDAKGLQISSVLNGAGEALQYLIQYSTHPEVTHRIDSAVDFLAGLDEVENELTSPERDYQDDPTRAQPGDMLAGGFSVVRRLGQGAFSVVLLVKRDGDELILKVANEPEHNGRLKDEAEILGKVRHPHVVELIESLELGDRAGFLMRPVFAEKDKDKKVIETLRQRLRKEGRLHIDLLQRFGEDLLGVICHLEEQGIPHRDIKPDNMAVGMVGRGDKLHVVLFDFSLSRTPADNIRAGTAGYLDPLLPLRKPPRWGPDAERYAAAVTLYEMASGTLPKWGDGATEPSYLGPDVEITIDPEQFDGGCASGWSGFSAKRSAGISLNASITPRRCSAPGGTVSRESMSPVRFPITATQRNSAKCWPRRRLILKSPNSAWAHVPPMLSTAPTSSRSKICSPFPCSNCFACGASATKLAEKIVTAVRILREQLGNSSREPVPIADETEPRSESLDVGSLSVDLLVERILKTSSREGESVQKTLRMLLGLDPAMSDLLAQPIGCGPRARRDPSPRRADRRNTSNPLVNEPCAEQSSGAISTLIIAGQGGVMSVAELIEAVLLARGSSQDEPRRTQLAGAAVRPLLEAERTLSEPRLVVRRDGGSVLVGRTTELTAYAHRLGDLADAISAEDPLVAPPRVIERLREVPAPAGADIADTRLVRLAATASGQAAVSSRQELYSRGMAALRLLTFTGGTRRAARADG